MLFFFSKMGLKICNHGRITCHEDPCSTYGTEENWQITNLEITTKTLNWKSQNDYYCILLLIHPIQKKKNYSHNSAKNFTFTPAFSLPRWSGSPIQFNCCLKSYLRHSLGNVSQQNVYFYNGSWVSSEVHIRLLSLYKVLNSH